MYDFENDSWDDADSANWTNESDPADRYSWQGFDLPEADEWGWDGED